MEKLSNTEIYEMIMDRCYDSEEIVAFCKEKIKSIAHKSAREKAKARSLRENENELYIVVKSLLTERRQTKEELFSQIEDCTGELTMGKMVAQLTNLIKDGYAIKKEVKDVNDRHKKKMYYMIAPPEDKRLYK